ncbi:hypothetical protein AWB82_06073 [Caballeronia glebae]|uniref:HNH endonuclease n=1 Tax=Caballeronia glebae TaxID=1777143 RepID=A0A158D091_9BURK|nr:HNH endonuclease [Caballeronia glebae]SAK87881.1 hypothetical protein AWB82_06073 [Caballeronia glebae]
MKRVTAGERLFYLVRDEALDASERAHANWSNLATLFNQVGSDANYSNYVKGAIAVHIVRKLLRYWETEKKNCADESLYVRKVTAFIKQDVFFGLSEGLVNGLARAVVQAESASFRPINSSVKENVLREKVNLRCYLCNRALEKDACNKHASHLTLEHLWPTSIGGDSIDNNLLPACKYCQEVTKDTASWEWLNIHNLVLPSQPSEEALIAVPNKVRFARHYLEAITLADEQKISLKQAFRAIGPMRKILGHNATGSPVTFFDLQTTWEMS